MKPNNVPTKCGSYYDRAHDPGRRSFLLSISGIVATASLHQLFPLFKSHSRPSFAELIKRELRNSPHVRRIGKAFLASRAAMNFDPTGTLERLTPIFASQPCVGLSLSPDLSLKTVGVRLQRVIRDDFTAGRTMQLEGWIVSLTEVELCGLATL
jgi:hypothetical protein